MTPLKSQVDHTIRTALISALTATGGNYAEAAKLLKTTRRVIGYHANRLKIKVTVKVG